MTRKLRTPEAAVLRACLDYLAIRGIMAWRNNTGAIAIPGKSRRFVRFGTVGAPDILGVLPGGRLLAVECKSSDGKPSAAQLEFLGRVRDVGGVAILARSLDDLIAGLKEAA